MNTVSMNTNLDAVIDDGSELRPNDDFRICRGDPTEGSHLNAAAKPLKPGQQVRTYDGYMMDHPPQPGNIEFFIDRLIRLYHLSQIGQSPHAVFVTPTGLSNQPLSF